MAATIFSLMMVLLIVWNDQAKAALAGYAHTPLLLIVVASLFLLVLAAYWVFSTLALQRAEKRLVPRVIDLFQRDWTIRFAMLGIAVFVILSYTFSIENLLISYVHPSALLLAWLVLLGAAIDLIHMVYSRVLRYVDPITALDLLEKHALTAAKNGDEIEAADWMDSLSTLASKACASADTTLAEKSLSKMYRVLEELTSRRLEYHITNERLSYPYVFYAQRLELAFLQAANQRSEGLCLHAMNQLGKAAVLGASVHESLAALPLVFINKLTRRSQKWDLAEVPEQTSVMLVEVARAIIEEAKQNQSSFKEPLLSVIGYLEEIELEKFKADKEIDIDILKQPFRELFQILKDEEILQHPDTVPVLQDVERVVGDLANLELVVRKMLMEEANDPAASEEPEQE